MKHKWKKIKRNGQWIEYCDKCDSAREIKENVAMPATSTGDVQGIQGGMGVVRRKVGINRKKISSVKKKKKDE